MAAMPRSPLTGLGVLGIEDDTSLRTQIDGPRRDAARDPGPFFGSAPGAPESQWQQILAADRRVPLALPPALIQGETDEEGIHP